MNRRAFLKVAAVSAVSVVPVSVALANEREERFKRIVLEHVKSGNEEALEKTLREHYDLRPNDSLDWDAVAVKTDAREDGVEILPVAPRPEVALGCVLIVIAVTVVFFGVVIYLIIQACKAPNGNTNGPPPSPPGTNTGPNTFYMAGSHSGPHR